MSPLFEIVCQNFETSLDSMLGLHEDIKIGNIEQNALQQIFTPWKEFVDSLPKPRLAPQAPSASTKSSWGRSHDKENEDESPFTRCLLWYKSSHKFVLLASNCPSLCHEDCLLLKDHIQFLLQPRVPSRSLRMPLPWPPLATLVPQVIPTALLFHSNHLSVVMQQRAPRFHLPSAQPNPRLSLPLPPASALITSTRPPQTLCI